MRNIENRLAMVPRANILRSKFDMAPFDHKTTFNAGKLIPIFCQECLPGGTYKLTTRELVRMSTPIHPVMDQSYLDTYFFFVPNRLVWDNWEEFMGENKQSYWTKDMPTYRVPHLVALDPIEKGSIANYFGIPIGFVGSESSSEFGTFNALPFRAYALIWNEWFRDQNTMEPIYFSAGSFDSDYMLLESGIEGSANGGAPAPVSKFHDYFTTSLPEPQRGQDVMLPLGDVAPVGTTGFSTPRSDTFNNARLRMVYTNGLEPTIDVALGAAANNGGVSPLNDSSIMLTDNGMRPDNLWADLSEATAATINDLRLAFAVQSFYEASARYGGRYTELLRGHFGVTSPDSRLQRPEYIGGKRSKINMQQVLQTSSTDDTSPQGNTAAFSLTADMDKSFTYSAVEHGYIIGVCCVRTKQTYQYGIERFWNRRDMFDFYFPEFAHIGEQPVYNKELYAQGTEEDNEVFGYQEAWADYRQRHSRISGAFSSQYAQTLDSWHYAEKLDSLPTLSAEFMQQSQNVVDRTLAVSSELEDQFLASFTFNMTCVLPMPMYSIPGFGMRF